MALERLTLAPPPIAVISDATDGGDRSSSAARLPRWTRQEILVLIQGKKVAETRVRRGRVAGMGLGAGQVEPKWASVSSYCKQHGVNRGPVQCRKRWSNLAGDYKKIKEWEKTQVKDEADSFWVMRNDLRRERKLPGFFDREVYEILDGGSTAAAAAAEGGLPVGLLLGLGVSAAEEEGEEAAGEEVEEEGGEVRGEAVFDSGRSAAAEDGLFSDFEQSTQEEGSGGGGGGDREFAAAKEAPLTSVPDPFPFSGAKHGTQQTSNPEMGGRSEAGHKRKRFAADGDEETNTLQYQLIDILERNGRMLSAQLEAQNTNIQLDREQRKDHMDSLVAVLDKVAGALGRIADKL
ncbi:hypothetical protein RHGRI_033188 [Rhododendron griersonianum]|uniref:Myb-like domain-containing protein n=1 Tax=Rhododendron griersonianum TaxID=479676 RepID=A0AAV6HWN5_9ERIC|nr:hypothetical protein RHGRI_033188 [Rhododendron griersonianum]